MYHDAYAHLYQKSEGFKINIKISENEEIKGYLSLKPSTRSTYDIAMRDATIDGLLTADKIEKVLPGHIFYKENNPRELFILQSVNEFEFQKITRNINAIKQNSFVTIQRVQFNEETGNDLGEALSLTAHLYDSTHKEVDFYNESLNLSCEWSWFYYNVGYGESVNIKEVFRTDSKGNKVSINKCFLEHKKLNLNN